VLACHAPQALALLKDATQGEVNVLGKFATTVNHTVLHTDSSLLPLRPAARAAWNYLLGAEGTSGVTVTYHMNRLQAFHADEEYCVTLNATEAIDPRRIVREMKYSHPLYNLDAIRAQGRWAEISGQNHTHFCGAYWSYGFHEDGLNSALRVAQALGVDW
jgi:predicted NAD/FAD-binding protein